jgi:hypothetical protein
MAPFHPSFVTKMRIMHCITSLLLPQLNENGSFLPTSLRLNILFSHSGAKNSNPTRIVPTLSLFSLPNLKWSTYSGFESSFLSLQKFFFQNFLIVEGMFHPFDFLVFFVAFARYQHHIAALCKAASGFDGRPSFGNR